MLTPYNTNLPPELRSLKEEIEGYARELPVAEHAHANAVLAQKYGEQYEMDSPEADGEDEETFIKVVSTPHQLRGEEP